MSSLAAIAPLPDAAAYSAAKAAILAFGLALRQRVGPEGIRVSVICPGFVATNMGEQYQGWRPLEMSADAAALAIERGLARDQAVIAFPRTLHLATQLSALAPEPLVRLAMSAFRFRFAKG
jgi:short-subunit dehydrogenase